MSDEKYIVFKRSDWDVLRGKLSQVEIPSILDRVLELPPVDDAVVIRLQDEFAESGLSAYAMNIQTVLDIVDPQTVGTGAYRSMEITRDYFHASSLDAGEIRRRGQAKLPD